MEIVKVHTAPAYLARLIKKSIDMEEAFLSDRMIKRMKKDPDLMWKMEEVAWENNELEDREIRDLERKFLENDYDLFDLSDGPLY